jgi:glycosyltransferase involved in cell wall biosynthesis
MRIAMLAWESLHSIPVGGVAAHVTELAAALGRQGHDVHVFTRQAPGQTDYEHKDGVHYYRCAYKGHHEFVDDINNMCRAFVHRVWGVEDSTGQPFDIIHGHDWLCANALIWIKKGRDRRTVLTVHATEYGRSGNKFHDGRSARVRDQERAGIEWADSVISVSHATRDEVCWMYEQPRERIDVVYNGVNRKRFDRPVDVGETRRKHQIGPLDPVVLFCGRLDFQKGPDVLLEAFPAALNDYGHAKLVFAGDGGMRGELERQARDRGMRDAVRFLGYRDGDELVDIFKMSDLVCLPSRNEPFGIVVLEAWSAGKPVLVTHNGGPSEYVEHEVDGLKIYENPGSVAWGLHQIFGDFYRARQMGAQGRRKVESGFTWESVAEQTLAVYDPTYHQPEVEPTLTSANLSPSPADHAATGQRLAQVHLRATIPAMDITTRQPSTEPPGPQPDGTNTHAAPAEASGGASEGAWAGNGHPTSAVTVLPPDDWAGFSDPAATEHGAPRREPMVTMQIEPGTETASDRDQTLASINAEVTALRLRVQHGEAGKLVASGPLSAALAAIERICHAQGHDAPAGAVRVTFQATGWPPTDQEPVLVSSAAPAWSADQNGESTDDGPHRYASS